MTEWSWSRDNLLSEIKNLGFPEELGNEIAKNLGSPKAMDRMAAYLRYVKPRNVELVVDEMLAIRSEIETWHRKKEGQEANEKYNEMLYNGLDGEDEE
jgi:hypothetical protein